MTNEIELTVEQIAAFAVAVHVREAALEQGMTAGQIGDHFPVDHWRDLYARALSGARVFSAGLYPDPEERVHKVVSGLRT